MRKLRFGIQRRVRKPLDLRKTGTILIRAGDIRTRRLKRVHLHSVMCIAQEEEE